MPLTLRKSGSDSDHEESATCGGEQSDQTVESQSLAGPAVLRFAVVENENDNDSCEADGGGQNAENLQVPPSEGRFDDAARWSWRR